MAVPYTTYEEFVSQVFYPTNFPDLKSPTEYESIQISIFGAKDSLKDTFEFDTVYPFQTIYDLQLKIWEAAEFQESYHPENQCLLLPSPFGGYTHFLYIFQNKVISLENPFDLMAGAPAHKLFVDAAGNAKPIEITSKSSMILEKTLFEKSKPNYQIHCFLYSDLYNAFADEKPLSAGNWNGKMRVYFPLRDRAQEDGSLTLQAEQYKDTLQLRHTCRMQLLAHLDEHLQGTPLRKPGETGRAESMKLSTVRNVRFIWKPVVSPLHKPFRLESFFYDTPVTEDFPYIRFYPKGGATPISKIHVEGPLNIPTLDPPDLLLQWADIPSITPQEDLVMIKCRLIEKDTTRAPLYITMFIHEDGSAKLIVQPNKGEKKLSSLVTFQGLGALLTTLTDSFPKLEPKRPGEAKLNCFPPQNIKLEDAYLSLELGLEMTDEPITKKSIRQLLSFYRPFFQVTSSPIRDTNPIANLRYKCVSNFQTPARDAHFLKRISELQKLSGETNLRFLKEYYLEEFDVPDEVANERVTAYLTKSTDFTMIDPSSQDFVRSTNYGIDIAIFGKHPYYTFHLYGIDSLVNLKRIKTILSLLITLPLEEFDEVKRCLNPLEEEEVEDAVLADEEAVAKTREALGEDEEDSPTGSPASRMAGEEAVAEALGSREEKTAFNAFGAFEGFGEDEEEDKPGTVAPPAAASAPKEGVKTPLASLVAEDAPEEAPEEAPPAGAKSKKASKKADEDDDEEVEEEDDEEEGGPSVTEASQLKQVPAKFYFGKRLTFYDRALFDWSVGGKGKGKKKSYRTMCQATQAKQPTVMTEEEYQRMKDIYKVDMSPDPPEAQRVIFVEYPLKKGQVIPKPMNDDVEVITTLRYGSSLGPGDANVYICSKYWCRTDDIVVLADDFEGTTDRKGRRKDPMTCPFCGGGLISPENKKKIVKGESVLERTPKAKTKDDKRHLYVRFLGKTLHPSGLYLPCCFLKDKAIYEDKSTAFASVAAAQAKLAPGGPQVGKPAPLAPAPALAPAVDYKRKIQDPKHWYIVGGNKYPLEMLREGPQVGVLPPAVDRFFGQDSYKDLVVNFHTVWKLKSVGGEPNVSGFFRIAIDNRQPNQYDSFLSAVAPYFGKNSAVAFKTFLAQVVQPTLFLQLNYGNFLFDFYDPKASEPHTLELKLFASKKLFVESGVGAHKEALVRAWKGYSAFEEFLESSKARKEYRMFAQLLSLPNVLYWEDETQEEGEQIRRNGVLFIVLEVKADGSVQVRCPPYGVTKSMADTADIAFILQYEGGIWEPIFYTENNATEQTSYSFFIFTRNTEPAWPAVVKQRFREFREMCFSSGLGIYTESYNVSNSALLPLKDLMTIRTTEVHAILRDSYNHIAGVLFKTPSGVVLVPAVDDGTVYPTTKVELLWKNLVKNLALASDARRFYAETLAPLLSTKSPTIQAMYQIREIIRLDKSAGELPELHALRLAGGLLVPVREVMEAEGITKESEIREGFIPPFILDSKLVFGKLTPSKSFEVDYKEFQEIYQHFRLTFANYLAFNPAVKTQVEQILFKDGQVNRSIPIFEKRQRLFLKLGNELLSWLDSSIPVRERKPSLKRIDCKVQKTASDCNGACVWKAESEECLLHTPESVDFGSESVDAKNLLIRKLFEELIRFPLKRDQLLKQRVSEYIRLRQAFRQRDEYIVPEDIATWADLLRMEWKEEKAEVPKYIEEYTLLGAPAEKEVEAENEEDEEALPALPALPAPPVPVEMPDQLSALLGSKAPTFAFFQHSSNSVLPILQTMGVSLDSLTALGQIPENPVLGSQEVAEEVAQILKMSIYQMMYEEDNPVSYEALIVPATIEKKGYAPFLFIVQLADGSVGVLSSSSDSIQPIAWSSMPGKTQLEIMKHVKKGGVKVPV